MCHPCAVRAVLHTAGGGVFVASWCPRIAFAHCTKLCFASRSMPHDPALVDVDDGVRCAVAFFDAQFGSWRVDLEEEARKAVACRLRPPDNVGTLKMAGEYLPSDRLVMIGRLPSSESSLAPFHSSTSFVNDQVALGRDRVPPAHPFRSDQALAILLTRLRPLKWLSDAREMAIAPVPKPRAVDFDQPSRLRRRRGGRGANGQSQRSR